MVLLILVAGKALLVILSSVRLEGITNVDFL